MNLPEYKKPGLQLEGAGFYLRPLVESDATDRYVSWLNNPETTRYLETRPGGSTIDSVKDYIRYHAKRDDSLLLGIFLVPGDKHIGNIKLEPIILGHKRAVMGIMIGDSSSRGRGLGSKVVDLVVRYAFNDMGLNRIELGVTSDNIPAIACYERSGFIREAVHRQATLREGGFINNYYYALLKSDYSDREKNVREYQS